MGIRNLMKSRVLEKNDNCYFVGYPCHIIHNTAHAGLSTFLEVSLFQVEDFCIDLYYFFDKSSKIKSVLMEYTQFCNHEYRKILT